MHSYALLHNRNKRVQYFKIKEKGVYRMSYFKRNKGLNEISVLNVYV